METTQGEWREVCSRRVWGRQTGTSRTERSLKVAEESEEGARSDVGVLMLLVMRKARVKVIN